EFLALLEAGHPPATRRRPLLAAMALLLILGSGALVRAAQRPARITVITSPIARQVAFVPPPTVEVLDAMGRRRRSEHDTVWVSASPGVRLIGDTMAVTDSGLAVF